MGIIKVSTQEEYDNIDKNFKGVVEIIGTILIINKLENFIIMVTNNGKICNLFGNAKIRDVYDNAEILNIYDNAEIMGVSGNAKIMGVSDNAKIRDVYDNAEIMDVSRNVEIMSVSGNAKIRDVSGNTKILNVYDNAKILNVSDNTNILNVYGNAEIKNIFGNSKVTTLGENIVILDSNKDLSQVKLNTSDSTSIIYLSRNDNSLEWYKRVFGVKVINENVILYKMVHKKEDGIYISNYDRDFIYKIGGEIKTINNENKDVLCTYGLHISHKMWAINYGGDWPDAALLEVSVPINSLVIPTRTDGKVRTSQLKVLREVPKEEWYD